ncbi:hypothetical protein [uncultured Brevundimonas sp.]|uniref:hypothetical protein n=1 Tax=uncultured Brevundimonas sp. TaxID=213418 RepID=UPI00262EE28C|nr:hypothetical protein [uncultured Brevundimonas sp.]
MPGRVVRKTDLARVLDVLAAHDMRPTACTLLPSGDIRLHLTEPAAVETDDPAAMQESKGWDAAFG